MKRCTTPFVSSSPLPSWWRPLFEASGSDSAFLTPEWMHAWVAIYGADFDGLWVHWEADGRVVAGCLLVERVVRVKRIPLRSQFLNATGEAACATPMAEFNDVLCLPGHVEAVAADLAQFLKTQSWSRLLLCGHEGGGVAARLHGLVDGVRTDHETKPAPYVDLAALGGRPFETTLTGKSGTYMRRNRRAYETQLGAVELTRAGDVPQALAFFEQMRELHLARWASRDKATSLAEPAVVDFLRRMIAALFAQGGVDLLRVGSATQPVGYLYNFVVRGKVSMFQSGFAYEADSKRSPGMLTLVLAIEYYRQRGLREYDFLAGDAQYKRTLSNGLRELLWTTVYRDRAWMRVLLAGHRLHRQFVGRPAPVPAIP